MKKLIIISLVLVGILGVILVITVNKGFVNPTYMSILNEIDSSINVLNDTVNDFNDLDVSDIVYSENNSSIDTKNNYDKSKEINDLENYLSSLNEITI